MKQIPLLLWRLPRRIPREKNRASDDPSSGSPPTMWPTLTWCCAALVVDLPPASEGRGRAGRLVASAANNVGAPTPLPRGSLVALVTPMHPDGALDLRSLRGLLQLHVASGTDGVVALGTTGESSVLSME